MFTDLEATKMQESTQIKDALNSKLCVADNTMMVLFTGGR